MITFQSGTEVMKRQDQQMQFLVLTFVHLRVYLAQYSVFILYLIEKKIL